MKSNQIVASCTDNQYNFISEAEVFTPSTGVWTDVEDVNPSIGEYDTSALSLARLV